VSAFSHSSRAISRGERILFWCLFAVLVLLRIRYAYTYRIDSDEPQHLHIVWAWTVGQVQYRDVFDNHAPLFHILCVPLLRLFGERPDIVIPMRLAMLPLFAICLWCVCKIGARLYSPRVGLWSAVIAGFMPRFFQTSTEYRTDDLWAMLWLVAVAILVTQKLTAKRIASAAFVLGLTFSVSMKTTLLLVSLLASGAAVAIFAMWKEGLRFDLRRVLVGLAATSAILIVPAILIAFFCYKDALSACYYCVIQHNIVPGLKRWSNLKLHSLLFAIELPLVLSAAYFLFRKSRAPFPIRFARTVTFLIPLIYYITLFSFWPDITREDYLPYCPLAALILVPPLIFIADWLAQRFARAPLQQMIPFAAAAFEMAMIIVTNKPWHNDTRRDIVIFAEALQLTRPGEYVMDGKAGAIFRPRPFYYALETITRTRMKMGLIPDNIAERLVATHTAIVSTGSFLGWARSSQFVRQNYLPVGTRPDKFNVLGKVIHASDTPACDGIGFDVAVPENYVVLNDGAKFSGTLDGQPLDGPRRLEAGHHELRGAITGNVDLFWSRAWENGYAPNHEADQSSLTAKHKSRSSHDVKIPWLQRVIGALTMR